MPEDSGKLTEKIGIYGKDSQFIIDKLIVSTSPDTPKPSGIRQKLPPTGAKKFVGREKELAQLHQFLQHNQQVVIAAISGMGGVGKTELALQYAIQHQASYAGGICWCGVKSENVGSQIVQFARHLGLNPPQDLDLSEQLNHCWLRWHEGEVLLVLDDVSEYSQIKPYLPSASRFKVLLTSRQSFGASIKQLPLDVLQPDAALDLLRSLIGDERVNEELSQAESLCAWLGYLPLGLELVGRYLVRKQDLSLADMWQKLENKRLEESALKKHKKDEDMTAVHKSVFAAFELSWKELADDDKQLGCLLSLFASAPIPWELVKLCLPEVDAEELEEIRDDSLLTLHLLQRQAKGVYQMHPLLREFFQYQLIELNQAEELKHSFCQVMVTVAQEIPEDPTLKLITVISLAMPHVAEVAKNLTVYLCDEDLAVLFTGLGRFYEGQGFYSQAEKFYEQCRVTVEKRFATEHPYLATILSNLGSIYYTQGRYTEAEPLHQKVLEMRRKLFGKEHADVADSLNNLALLSTAQGKYAEAETLYNQALDMRRKCLGEEHIDVTDSLNNLALLYDTQGRYQKAEKLFLQALEMRKRLLGTKHPRVATSLNNLASCYHSQERYEEAENKYQQSLQLSQELLGEKHYDVAIALNNLAEIYAIQRKYEEAKPLFTKALEIQKHIFGEVHPDVATVLNNIASLSEDLGNIKEAEILYKQVLEMRKQLLGETHFDVAISLNNLAKFYYSQNRYQEAEPLYINALEILKPLLGPDHPVTTKVQSNWEELKSAMKISSGNV
ncbi:tetratricopeptide repeat protein [Pelatocladus sp. BLCC-F211]|uniref:tetratricopeptide repeat protein n=1 Tax=Pelatocladus sp. BLCC-F211 TaxID=3342752 RepID=UPI0035B89D2B